MTKVENGLKVQKGGGQKKTGEVAVHSEGLKLYNSFRNLHAEIMQHDEFSTFNDDVIDMWMERSGNFDQNGRALTQGEANNVTQATEAPDFSQVFDSGLGFVFEPVDITGV